jgi:anti-sigma factor ChrR (cupin superfamily)
MRIPGLKLAWSDDNVPWRSTSYPGIYWLALHLDPTSGSDDATVLIRMDPGRGYPAHRHVGIEEVLVLSGGYRDELGVHEAGSYVRYPAGSSHSPVATGDASRAVSGQNPACVLFAVARGGVALLGDRRS